MPSYGQDPMTGWEAKQRGLTDTAISRYLGDFTQGGAYAPERIMALFNESYGQDLPMASMPSAGAGMGYARNAMDLASGSAALQAGNAAQSLRGQGLRGMTAGLSQIARGAGANVGQAGVGAYQQGLGIAQQTGLANQNVMMQARQGALGLFGQSAQNAYGAGQFGANDLTAGIRDYWRRRDEAKQRKDAAWGQAIGTVAGLGAAYLTGGASAAPGATGTEASGALGIV